MVGTIIGILKTAGAFLITPQGAGIGLGVLVVAYVLKRIDNTWVYEPIYWTFHKLGVACTLGASKLPYLRAVWNKTLEPFVIDLLENVLSAAKDGLFAGLHSDN